MSLQRTLKDLREDMKANPPTDAQLRHAVRVIDRLRERFARERAKKALPKPPRLTTKQRDFLHSKVTIARKELEEANVMMWGEVLHRGQDWIGQVNGIGSATMILIAEFLAANKCPFGMPISERVVKQMWRYNLDLVRAAKGLS